MFGLVYRTCCRFSVKNDRYLKYLQVRGMVQQCDFIGLKMFIINEENKDQHFLRELINVKTEAKLNEPILYKITKTNIHYLSLSLQYLATVQQKLQKNIITPSHYHSLLNHYFSKTDKTKDKNFNLVDKFIHLDNKELMKFIKRNQIQIIENQIQRGQLKHQIFQKVIGNQLFNITDLPMMMQILYQGYFPSLKSVRDLKDVHYSLIYLSQFSKIPYFLPKNILKLIEQRIALQQQIQFKEFMEINNVILMLTYHFRQNLQSVGLLTQFEKVHKRLIDKIIMKKGGKQIESTSESIVQVIQSQNKNAFKSLFEQRKKTLKIYKEKAQKLIQQKEDSCINEILRINFKKSQLNLENSSLILKQTTQMESKLNELKIILLGSSNSFLESNILYHYLKNQKIKEFISNNSLIPNLYRQLDQTNKILKQKATWTKNNQSQNFDQLIQGLSKHIDLTVKETVSAINQNYTKKSAQIWKIQYQQLFQHILSEENIEKILNFSYSNNNNENVLKLLKNDPEYLISLMKWNSYHFLTNSTLLQHFQNSFKIAQNTYSQGIGFKVIKTSQNQNQKSSSLRKFKLKTELLKNISQTHSESKQKQQYLKGSLRSMLTSIKNSTIKDRN